MTRQIGRRFLYAALGALLLGSVGRAQGAAVEGKIADPLSAAVPHASVELRRDGKILQTIESDEDGHYRFEVTAPGEFQIWARANGFGTGTTAIFYLGKDATANEDLTLPLGTLTQTTVVTDTGTPQPEAEATSSVTALNLQPYRDKLDVQDVLRLIPGLQLTQTGQRGGTTSLFVRGGMSDANKVMIDGIAANDIGGSFDFANLALGSFGKVEVFRGPDSTLYGADALASVVDLTSTRGATRLPQLQYSVDGGNFGTVRQDVSLGQQWRNLDYFSEFARFDTNNSLPHSGLSETTAAGNFGWEINGTTHLRATVRRITADESLVNGLDLYAIPDNEIQHNQYTYVSATLENQTTDKWHNLLRYGATRLDSQNEQPSPAGLPVDPFNAGYPTETVGAPVTLRGANGYVASGQAEYYFIGTYPATYLTQSDQDFADFDSRYDFASYLSGLFSFRYANERGMSISQPYDSVTAARRNNFSYTGQLSGNIKSRLFYSAGVGVDDNAVFGLAASPHASLSYFLSRPREGSLWSGTKLRFSYGQGIKEPSIAQQVDSLYGVLAALPNGEQLLSQHHISPIGPERSTTFDTGVEQYFLSSRLHLAATFFHNQFSNQMEYVAGTALPQLGVPADVATQIEQTSYGAYVNSLRYRALGTELELDGRFGKYWTARGGWTYLDAVVERSFSSDALSPSINPDFPGVAIGAYSPLIGARPFRQAPQSGFFALFYSRERFDLAATGTLVGRRDDSTFLTDEFGGTTLLLPNRNLDAAYQDLSFLGSYRLSRWLSLYANADNLLSQHYQEAFGYPAAPFNFRVGMRFTLGGESWMHP